MKVIGVIFAVLVGLFVLIMVLGSNSGYPEVGEAVLLQSSTTPTCPSKPAIAQLLSLMSQGDTKAAAELGYRARCEFTGGPFILQIKEPFEDYWCVRRNGNPDCAWVSKSAVAKALK